MNEPQVLLNWRLMISKRTDYPIVAEPLTQRVAEPPFPPTRPVAEPPFPPTRPVAEPPTVKCKFGNLEMLGSAGSSLRPTGGARCSVVAKLQSSC